jgi:hypothetical protein
VNPTEGLFPDLGQSSTTGQTPYAQWQANLQAAPGMAPVRPPQAIPMATSSPQPLHLVGQLMEPNHSSAVGAEPGPSVTPTMPQAAGYPIGTTPTDSISRIIISALHTHEGDRSEATRALGKLNIKVGPPPQIQRGHRPEDLRAMGARYGPMVPIACTAGTRCGK